MVLASIQTDTGVLKKRKKKEEGEKPSVFPQRHFF